MQVYAISGLPANKISHCVPAIKGWIGLHDDLTVTDVFAVPGIW